MLFGLPMRELTNRAVELGDVLGPDGARLPERLHEASGWPARFAILDELSSTASRAPSCLARRRLGLAALREADGRLRVSEPAEELRRSRGI